MRRIVCRPLCRELLLPGGGLVALEELSVLVHELLVLGQVVAAVDGDRDGDPDQQRGDHRAAHDVVLHEDPEGVEGHLAEKAPDALHERVLHHCACAVRLAEAIHTRQPLRQVQGRVAIVRQVERKTDAALIDTAAPTPVLRLRTGARGPLVLRHAVRLAFAFRVALAVQRARRARWHLHVFVRTASC